MEKRSPAVVNIPIPERLILTATGFAPNSMQRKMARHEVPKGSSLLELSMDRASDFTEKEWSIPEGEW